MTFEHPGGWLKRVNSMETEAELKALGRSVPMSPGASKNQPNMGASKALIQLTLSS
jgi:hypothetical protein